MLDQKLKFYELEQDKERMKFIRHINKLVKTRKIIWDIKIEGENVLHLWSNAGK